MTISLVGGHWTEGPEYGSYPNEGADLSVEGLSVPTGNLKVVAIFTEKSVEVSAPVGYGFTALQASAGRVHLFWKFDEAGDPLNYSNGFGGAPFQNESGVDTGFLSLLHHFSWSPGEVDSVNPISETMDRGEIEGDGGTTTFFSGDADDAGVANEYVLAYSAAFTEDQQWFPEGTASGWTDRGFRRLISFPPAPFSLTAGALVQSSFPDQSASPQTLYDPAPQSGEYHAYFAIALRPPVATEDDTGWGIII